MAVNYTTLLKLAQPVTGTESGTWGDYVNNAISAYLDASIAGTQTINTDTSPTLTLTEGTNSATNLGSTSAQYAIINLTGSRAAARTVTLPSTSRHYIILNNTTGGFATTFNPGTVSVAQGEDCVLAYDTSVPAYVKVASTISNLASVTGTLGAGSGGTGITAPGSAGNLLTSTGTAWASTANPFVGGRGQVFTATDTFILPTGVTAVKVTVVGAGGNGAATTNAGQGRGGGGGGGVAVKYVTGLSANVAVTVGTPGSGTSSFGAFASATGGAAGSGATGGAGGTGTTGDILVAGTAGGAGVWDGCSGTATGGAGGAQRLPTFGYGVGGAAAVTTGSYLPGNPGAGYGGGGGGAATATGLNQSGGAGTNGIVIVEW
jgi:hypothetical protein